MGCNIAHYSRYRIVHTTLVKAVKMLGGDKATTASGKQIQKPKLIVDVEVESASTADTQLFEGGVKGSEAVFTGFQGKKGAYDLELSDDGNLLEATKIATGEKLPASRTKGGSWCIEDEKDGKKHVRYIRPESVAASLRRKA
ncbi:MAG: hypothetical protein K5928_01145 [Prevotella sp.]|nr:hypothetical protein [Prevotella sp.]